MLSAEAIESLVRSFESCTLPRPSWTHQEHLLVALWYLWQHPREEAVVRIRTGIRRYNASQGNVAGYHETITLAWAAVIERFLAGRSASEPIGQLAEQLLAACSARDYLLRFYSRELLFSDEARVRWMPPDLMPIE